MVATRKHLPRQLSLPLGRRERVVNRQIRERARGLPAGRGPGRPRKRGAVSHLARPTLWANAALLVTWRVCEQVPNLRVRHRFAAVERALIAFCRVDDKGGRGFRVAHFTVLSNHLHLIVEADSKGALARGMQKLALSVSRRLNALSVRRQGGDLRHGAPFSLQPGWLGRIFRERYHAHLLRTPTEARRAIAYVLFNADKHYRQIGRELDPFSSARFFRDVSALRGPGVACPSPPGVADPDEPAPVTPARGWLLRIGWRRGVVRGRHATI